MSASAFEHKSNSVVFDRLQVQNLNVEIVVAGSCLRKIISHMWLSLLVEADRVLEYDAPVLP